MSRFGFPNITENAKRALESQHIQVTHNESNVDINMPDDTRYEKLKMYYGEIYVYLLNREIVLIYNVAKEEIDIPHDFDERDSYRDRLLSRDTYQNLPLF